MPEGMGLPALYRVWRTYFGLAAIAVLLMRVVETTPLAAICETHFF